MKKEMKLINLIPLREEFPKQPSPLGRQNPSAQQRQDPRTISIKNQLMGLIQNTDFDDNRSVDSLKTAIEGMLAGL